MELLRINKDLYTDEQFYKFLNATSSCLTSAVILKLETNIDVHIVKKETDELVSYLPISKLIIGDKITDEYYDKNKVVLKIGRLVRKLIPEIHINRHLNQQQIEDFVNLYKSFFEKQEITFEVLEGEEIRKWYNQENYLIPNILIRGGTLWNSCMRYVEKQPYLDIYCKNKNIKMLCMFQEQDGIKKLRSRALLMETKCIMSKGKYKAGDDIKVMDRIYTSNDHDFKTMSNWASVNGYIYKAKQNAKIKNLFIDLDKNIVELALSLKLENYKLENYPYLDTFSYFDIKRGFLYNIPNPEYHYELIQTDGSLSSQQTNIIEVTNNDNQYLEFDFGIDFDVEVDNGGY